MMYALSRLQDDADSNNSKRKRDFLLANEKNQLIFSYAKNTKTKHGIH